MKDSKQKKFVIDVENSDMFIIDLRLLFKLIFNEDKYPISQYSREKRLFLDHEDYLWIYDSTHTKCTCTFKVLGKKLIYNIESVYLMDEYKNVGIHFTKKNIYFIVNDQYVEDFPSYDEVRFFSGSYKRYYNVKKNPNEFYRFGWDLYWLSKGRYTATKIAHNNDSIYVDPEGFVHFNNDSNERVQTTINICESYLSLDENETFYLKSHKNELQFHKDKIVYINKP